MRFVSEPCRTVLHSALSVLVIAALAHCSWEESRELAQHVAILAQHGLDLPSPVQAPVHDCDRESGCICRGATQVAAMSVAHCQAQLNDLLPSPINHSAATWLLDPTADSLWSSIDDFSLPPPISGRQLRALYASLVI